MRRCKFIEKNNQQSTQSKKYKEVGILLPRKFSSSNKPFLWKQSTYIDVRSSFNTQNIRKGKELLFNFERNSVWILW